MLESGEKKASASFKRLGAIDGIGCGENRAEDIENWLAGLDLSVPDQVMVMLRLPQAVFVGRLLDVSSNCVIFDYLVLGDAALDYINSTGEMRLKNISSGHITAPGLCAVMSDCAAPIRSLFDMPMRRCVLQFKGPLSEPMS